MNKLYQPLALGLLLLAVPSYSGAAVKAAEAHARLIKMFLLESANVTPEQLALAIFKVPASDSIRDTVQTFLAKSKEILPELKPEAEAKGIEKRLLPLAGRRDIAIGLQVLPPAIELTEDQESLRSDLLRRLQERHGDEHAEEATKFVTAFFQAYVKLCSAPSTPGDVKGRREH